MSLEQKLSSSAEAWLAEETPSPGRVAALENLVRGRARRRRLQRGLSVAAAAAAVVSVAFTWPVMLSAASNIPVLGPVLARWARTDPGLEWAAQHGYVTSVGLSATDQGYTFRVESVLADAARTEIHYVIEGPGLTLTTPAPRVDYSFDGQLPIGGGRMTWDVVDGRMLGNDTLPPLPTPMATVDATVAEIAGVKGHWEVSFLASRAELDNVTRTVDVPTALSSDESDTAGPQQAEQPAVQPADQPAGGGLPLPQLPLTPEATPEPVGPTRTVLVGNTWNGTWNGQAYSLSVKRVLLAPTETVVEMSGSIFPNFTIRDVELVANGTVVPFHTGEFRYDGYGRWVFDPLKGDPAAVTFRLKRVQVMRPDGPVIDLSRPGVRTTYGRLAFEPLPVRTENGQTVVDVKIGCPGAHRLEDYSDDLTSLGGGIVVDAEGNSENTIENLSIYDPEVPDAGIWRWRFAHELKGPLRLEFTHHFETVPGPFEVTIPLK